MRTIKNGKYYPEQSEYYFYNESVRWITSLINVCTTLEVNCLIVTLYTSPKDLYLKNERTHKLLHNPHKS